MKQSMKDEIKQNKYYIIKVNLEYTPAWRKFLIPSGTTFRELQEILLIAFDWDGDHCSGFDMGTRRNLEYIEDYELDNTEVDEYFEKYKKIRFIYDYGDNWEHTIKTYKPRYKEEKILMPICTEAKFITPEEDCGFNVEIPNIEEVDIDEINNEIKRLYKVE